MARNESERRRGFKAGGNCRGAGFFLSVSAQAILPHSSHQDRETGTEQLDSLFESQTARAYITEKSILAVEVDGVGG